LLSFGAQSFVFQFAIQKFKDSELYRNIIFPVALYGCGTWLLTLREERRLRVFENRVLRRVFGPKREEVTVEWRKLHNEELTQYCSGDKIDKNEMGGSCNMHGERRGAYRELVLRPEGKRPLGRPRCRWEDNIKMDIQEVGCGSIDWIKLAQDRDRWKALVNAAMNFRVP